MWLMSRAMPARCGPWQPGSIERGRFVEVPGLLGAVAATGDEQAGEQQGGDMLHGLSHSRSNIASIGMSNNGSMRNASGSEGS